MFGYCLQELQKDSTTSIVNQVDEMSSLQHQSAKSHSSSLSSLAPKVQPGGHVPTKNASHNTENEDDTEYSMYSPDLNASSGDDFNSKNQRTIDDDKNGVKDHPRMFNNQDSIIKTNSLVDRGISSNSSSLSTDSSFPRNFGTPYLSRPQTGK